MDPTQATVLITGSTDGVGRLVATRAGAAGARVLVHGRSDAKGRDTLTKIQREAPRSHVEYYRADLASLDDVRCLADEVMSAHDRLDILINNAGVGFGPPGGRRETSRDGHELRFAVNYLAPFLLTHLLLPTLRRSAPSRIVNVASIGQAPIDFDEVMLTCEYDGRQAYGQSKLALVMLTFDLAVVLQGTGVTANAIHPATLMNTKMVAEAALRPQSTVEEGAEAIFHLATSPELEGVSGRFFDGRPAPTQRRTIRTSGNDFEKSRSNSPGNRRMSPDEEGFQPLRSDFRSRQLRAGRLLAFLAKSFEVGAHQCDFPFQAAGRGAQRIDGGFGIPQALLRSGVRSGFGTHVLSGFC